MADNVLCHRRSLSTKSMQMYKLKYWRNFRHSCGAHATSNVVGGQAIDSSNAENDTVNNFCLVDFRAFNNLKRSNKITGSHVKSLISVLVLRIINISFDLQTEKRQMRAKCKRKPNGFEQASKPWNELQSASKSRS